MTRQQEEDMVKSRNNVDRHRWLMLMIVDTDEGEGRRGGRLEDNGGVPITQNR